MRRRHFVKVISAASATTLLFGEIGCTKHVNDSASNTLVKDTIPSVPINKISGLKYDIEYYIIYGQSLSDGTNGIPVLTTTQKYNNIMFQAGPRFWEDVNHGMDSFVPLHEQVGVLDPNNLGETSSSGLSNMLTQSIINTNPTAYNNRSFLVSTPGYGGLSLQVLGNHDNIYYERLIGSVYTAAALAKAQGKTFGVRGVAWVQGNSNSSIGQYDASYNYYLNAVINFKRTMLIDMNMAINTVYGYDNGAIPFVSYQYTRNKLIGCDNAVGMAQLQAAKQEPGFYVSGPDYQYPYGINNEHFNIHGNLQHGANLGKFFYDINHAGIERKPFIAQSATVSGNNAVVTFNPPSGTLMFDTSLSIPKPNMGFTIIDGGTGPVAITSLFIMADKKSIQIAFTRPVVAGDKLQYAINGGVTNSLDNDQNGGNVRDTQGDTVIYDPQGENWPVYNWLLMHEFVF